MVSDIAWNPLEPIRIPKHDSMITYTYSCSDNIVILHIIACNSSDNMFPLRAGSEDFAAVPGAAQSVGESGEAKRSCIPIYTYVYTYIHTYMCLLHVNLYLVI